MTDQAAKFDVEGTNQTGVRERNERLVLSILRREGPLPKAEIARRTGLSAQTASVIMRALESDGLIAKGEKVRGRVGQPSVPMSLAPGGAYFFGLSVGRRSVELILTNFVGQEIAHRRESYAYPLPSAVLDFVKTASDEILQVLEPAQVDRISGMGIAIPFFLWDWAVTIGADPEKMDHWKNFDLRNELSKLFEFPIYVGNDASCACSAELVFGAAKTPADFLYIYFGHFIGGGVVMNGALYTGSSGNAGAIGPFPIRGRQMVDVASLNGLERRLVEATGSASEIIEKTENWNLDAKILEDWLAEAVPAVTRMITGAISIIDFPAVLIDGNLPTDLREVLVDRITMELKNENLAGLVAPQIIEGSLGSKARPMGAVSLPLAKRYMLEA